MKRIALLTLLSLSCFIRVQAQSCTLTLFGQIIEKESGNPMSFATIKVIDLEHIGAIADVDGRFSIKNLCAGSYHLEISFVGYSPERKFIELKDNTSLTIELTHHNELLNEIVVHGNKEESSTQIHNVIGQDKIRSEGNKNLADVLENVSGVSVLKTGSGVSKPIIHGLYGNRISILNNGVVQAGQQWGNDHAPEIDPFVADHISVVKGAAALEYGGNSIGGVVLVDPYKIENDPHLHGKATYVFQSNGLGHTLNTQVEKADKWASWRALGTIKYMGDAKSPNYYLTNTGRREANFALQVDKNFSAKWSGSAYYSLFHTNLGILRGSHIGNLTDLEEAIGREEPFYTQDQFSYSIESPRQEVTHHLLKLESEHVLKNDQFLTFRYGGQIDDRREFDVRRGGRSDLPALSLLLISHSLEGVYEKNSTNGTNLKFGIQTNYTDNTNSPETGVLPLIPDYQSFTSSIFGIWQKETDSWLYEAGARYDLKLLNVLAISRTLPRVIEHYNHVFHNYAFNAGIKHKFDFPLNLNTNIGFAQRAPEVNELYSYGLHQGVSGIEEGSPDLVPESSLKGLLSADWDINKKVLFQGTVYAQNIDNYIYLEPQDELELTIRGAFPVYIYKQTDALIYGMDLLASYQPSNYMKANLVYAIVRGEDRTNNTPLIYMPSDNLKLTLSYFPKDGNTWVDNSFSVNGRYVFEQTRYPSETDFLEPPDGYFLLGLDAGTGVHLEKSHLNFKVRVENMLNTTYRDYLNRMRYYADELGINVSLNVNYTF